MSSPFSVGKWGLPEPQRSRFGSGDNSVTGILGDVRRLLMALVDRLAPDKLFQPVTLNSLAVGEIVDVNLQKPFNGVLVSLKAGIVDLYFGDSIGNGVPDLSFGPSLNPTAVYMPDLEYNRVKIVVSADSPTAATGKIHFMRY